MLRHFYVLYYYKHINTQLYVAIHYSEITRATFRATQEMTRNVLIRLRLAEEICACISGAISPSVRKTFMHTSH